MILEIFLFAVLIFLLLRIHSQKPHKYPPGPAKWPIVGSRLQLKSWGHFPYLCMAEAARRYGAVVGLFNGNEPVILVSSLEAIKEVSYREEFSGRPKTLIQESDKGSYGIGMVDGEKWKEQRRFTLRHLRDLGFGKQTLEEIVHEELSEIFTLMEKVSGGEKLGWPHLVTVHDVIGSSRINVLWCIVAGKRYSISDPFINEVLDCAVKLFRLCESGGGSIISKLFPSLGTFPRLMHYRKRIQNFLMEEIKKHKESLDSNSPRDFIDVYLTEMEKQKFNKQSTFEERQLVETCLDLFVAGSDSSFSLLVFSILFMVLYPDVQLKVQGEIDRIIGRDRLPSLTDKASLPYVEATMCEILRRSSVAPLGVPHAILGCSKDVKLQGYILPKNSRIILNLYGLHHDPKIWGDPFNFRPERFLDSNGKFVKHEALLPFGAGKRSCLGEVLARNNFFLFFTGLMQRYSMKVPDGHPRPSEVAEGGLSIAPKRFEIKLKVRN